MISENPGQCAIITTIRFKLIKNDTDFIGRKLSFRRQELPYSDVHNTRIEKRNCNSCY